MYPRGSLLIGLPTSLEPKYFVESDFLFPEYLRPDPCDLISPFHSYSEINELTGRRHHSWDMYSYISLRRGNGPSPSVENVYL